MSPPHPETPLHTHETPSQRVFSNTLIMSQIHTYLSKPSRLSCLLTSKAGFMSVVPAVYRNVGSDIGGELWGRMCPLGRLHYYLASITSITLIQPYYPISIPLHPLSQQFPSLHKINFTLPTRGITGVLLKSSSSSSSPSDVFDELHLTYGMDYVDPLQGQLISPRMGLCGPRRRFRLTSLTVNTPAAVHRSGAASIFDYFTDDVSFSGDPTIEEEALSTAMENLRVVDLGYVACALLSLRRLLKEAKGLEKLSFTEAYLEDKLVVKTLGEAGCGRLRELDVRQSSNFGFVRCIAGLVRGGGDAGGGGGKGGGGLRAGLSSLSIALDPVAFSAGKPNDKPDRDCMAPASPATGTASCSETLDPLKRKCNLSCYRALDTLRITCPTTYQSPPNPHTFALALRRYFGDTLEISITAQFEYGSGPGWGLYYPVSQVNRATGNGNGNRTGEWARHVMDIRRYLRAYPAAEKEERLAGWRKVEEIKE